MCASAACACVCIIMFGECVHVCVYVCKCCVCMCVYVCTLMKVKKTIFAVGSDSAKVLRHLELTKHV